MFQAQDERSWMDFIREFQEPATKRRKSCAHDHGQIQVARRRNYPIGQYSGSLIDHGEYESVSNDIRCRPQLG